MSVEDEVEELKHRVEELEQLVALEVLGGRRRRSLEGRRSGSTERRRSSEKEYQ
jgi:hypothetical protein